MNFSTLAPLPRLSSPRTQPQTPRVSPPIGRRFTLDGSDALENRLARLCAQILAGLRGLLPAEKLEAVLLGGGYGRGEGGVLATDEADDQPYNDLEFYVCLRGNRHLNELRYHRPLEVLGQILTPQAGAEVEFKITSLAAFTQGPISMFSYDLISGHRLLFGHGDWLDACGHHAMAENIPPAEATRLLMNRCSGLLFARERLERPGLFSPEDADFVRRNIAKAELALGDAVLTVHGRYHWSCRERWRRLQTLELASPPAWLDQVRHHHAIGVDFKLHPTRCIQTRESLADLHAKVTALALPVWLWLEARRLGAHFSTVGGYVGDPRDKCPETGAARNLLINLKAFGPRLGWVLDRPLHHPRERILHALSLLLWDPSALDSSARLGRLHTELRSTASTYSGLMAAYRALWARVN